MNRDQHRRSGERGMALLLVLLVTAMLIALIFEFAYGTRVSLRAAANYRDSRRAYYLARSGVYVFAKFKELQDYVPQGEWGIVPVVSQGDTVLRIRWEDEQGKIYVADPTKKTPNDRLVELFGLKAVNLDVIEVMKDRVRQIASFKFLSELHETMSDEEYDKISGFVSVFSGSDMVNVNTASAEVLESIGIPSSGAAMIVDRRTRQEFTTKVELSGQYGIPTSALAVLVFSSNVFTVHSSATVGEYTKEIVAVISRPTSVNSPSNVLYWRAL